jgi:glutathione S-transferase
MTRTLYYTARSPYARKVLILLAEKNLAVELRETDIINKSPEFLKISPIGKVPVLVDEDGTTLWDSTLIIEYLDETYPEPNFYPREKKAYLQSRQWEELADTLADNAITLWYQKLKSDPSVDLSNSRNQLTIDRVLAWFNQQLIDGDYLLGNTFSAVDIATVSALGYYNLRFGEDWQQKYLKLGQWFTRLHERESIRSTAPKA